MIEENTQCCLLYLNTQTHSCTHTGREPILIALWVFVLFLFFAYFLALELKVSIIFYFPHFNWMSYDFCD